MSLLAIATGIAVAATVVRAEPATPPMGGRWISALSGQGNYRPAMRLATDFTVTNPVKRATLRATALGLYVPFVNGREITERRMMPGWTQYEYRVPSQTFDVTSHLVSGTNCLAVLVGDGWYCGQISYVGQPQGSAGWGRYPCFRDELTLEYADGSVTKLGTGRNGWRSFYGDPATLVNDIYQGEEYDALMDDTRWKRAGLKGGDVREVAVSTEILGDIGQPVVVTRVLKPAKTSRRPSGTRLLDFGENVVGVERIRLKKAHQGASIVIRHGEDLDRNGNLWRDNLAFAGAKTVLHCGSHAPFEYAPRFTFYGFRYLEISGWPEDEELTPDSVTVEVISSAVRETGTFECSNPLINAFFANVKRSQQANFIDVPTDCPQRCERFGWTGDAQIFAETAMMNYDVRRFFVKWLGDLRLCRARSGAFPDIAPWPPQDADTSAATGSAGWADAGVVCPWMLYRKYGDRSALREAFPSIVKYVDLISSVEQLNTIGDHLNLDQKTSNAFLAEALRIEMLRLASLAATALGESYDAARFAKVREGFVAAFRERHFGVDGLPKERTQTAAAFAIAYGLCRDEAAKKATGELLKELIAERDGHLATGFLGTPVLLRALAESGNLEAAYKLLEVTTSPGWLYPVTQGATTVWERWDAKVGDRYNESWMNSLNHYAYGSVTAWFYDTIAGIRDLTEESPDAPGFRRFRLAPQPGGSLTYAKATHVIPDGGVISSAWERKDGVITWSFAVPTGTEAEIVPPGPLTVALPEGVSVERGRLVAKPGRYVVVCGGAACGRVNWVNVGSNSGRLGFDWQLAGTNGLNLAGCPQGTRRDFAKVKAHRAEIADGAYVIIPLCPFTSVLQPSYDDRPSTDSNPLLAFDGERSEAELVKFRDFLDRIWKKEFAIIDYADPMTDANRRSYAQMLVVMREFIDWCKAEKLRPVLVYPPAAKCFDTLFPESFMKAYVHDFVKDLDRPDVPFVNYWKDPAFRANRLWANALFLNKTGRKAFTERVMRDVKGRYK